MNVSDIAHARLASQLLTGTVYTTPKEIVSWMGAMQSQDFPMARWGIGARLPGITDLMVIDAIDHAEITRTHLLRPTWHFVAAEDVYWLLDLTAPQIKAGQRARDRQLELTKAVYAKSNSVIEKALRDETQLTREQLLAALTKAGIAIDQNRSAHLLMQAELDQIICSGAIHKGKPSYALLSNRVPKVKRLTKEEALANLAERYFTSRVPATLQDFTWWSGLSATDARQAIELVQGDIFTETIDGKTYYFTDDFKLRDMDKTMVHLLPPFDEFVVSYTDRSASIESKYAEYMTKISNRGVFWPIVVINGQVNGIWKRTFNKDSIDVDIELFSTVSRSTRSLIDRAAASYGLFSGKAVEIKSYANHLP